MKSQTFELRPIPPFRLDLTAWALRRRPHNSVDRWDGKTWRRVLVVENELLEASATQLGTTDCPRLLVTLTGQRIPQHAKEIAVPLLRKTFGLSVGLTPFYRLAERDKRLAPLMQRFRGLKPPRFPSIFEGLVNAIACQQLSLTVGIVLLNRLADRCGPALSDDGKVRNAFPRPEDVLRLSSDSLRTLGFSYGKARYALELAYACGEAQLDERRLEKLTDQEALRTLLDLRGIGRWTGEYVLLRCLGRTNVFPGDDVGARNRLARWMGRHQPMDYQAVVNAVRRWQPYSGFVYFHLLLDGLVQSGAISMDSALA